MVDVLVVKDQEILYSGAPCDAREFIQDLLEEKLGFYVDLQESEEQEIIDNEELELYLHTDAYSDLDEEDLETLNKIGITDCNSIQQIEEFLGVSIRYVIK